MEELANKPLFVSAKKPYTRMTVAGVQYLVKTLGKRQVLETFIRTGSVGLLPRTF